MMKIGYFAAKFPYDRQFENYPYGGSIQAAYFLANEMAKKGHKINIFTTSRDSADSIEKYNNMEIYRYGTNFKILSSNIALRYFFKPLNYHTDIIHTHFDIPPGPIAGLIYAKKKKIPLVVTYHGDWVMDYGGFIRKIGVSLHNKYIVDKLLDQANIIISPSEYYINMSEFLCKYKDKIVVVPNGINLNEFDNYLSREESRRILGLPIHKKLILFFGYLSPYKGPDMLIKAMPKIIKLIPDVELVFAGRGVMRNQLETLSRKLGVEKKVKFLGFVKDALKPILYKSANVFVLPSIMNTESFGIVNLEAMACGIPIVASKIGGIPDVVVDGETGLLVTPKDIDALANSIIYILNNEVIAQKMGVNGLKAVQDYSWARIANRTEAVYNTI